MGTIAILVIGILIGGLTGSGLVTLFSGRNTAVPTQQTSTSQAAPTSAQAAIMDTIRRANQEQAQAFAAHDPSAMRDTSTAAHYDEMTQINSDLDSSGVTAIQLVDISFGDVTVSGTTAQATSYETWSSTFSDGTKDQSTDRNDYSLVQENGVWKIQSDVQPDSTPSGRTPPTAPQVPGNQAATVHDSSSNWSGYVAAGGTYTSVTGTWAIAKPSSATVGIDATWVGIGGISGNDLIQAGTQASVSGAGRIQYEAWIEALPQGAKTVPLTVTGGDSVTVSLTEQAAGQWLISLKNETSGKSYSTTMRYASSKNSAEWVQEVPMNGRRLAPLDDFGVVHFTDGSAVKDGRTMTISEAGGKAVTMIDASRQPLASPSQLGFDGSSFSVTRMPGQTSPGTGRTPGLPNRRG